jgi:hypothetical protein
MPLFARPESRAPAAAANYHTPRNPMQKRAADVRPTLPTSAAPGRARMAQCAPFHVA